MIGMLVPQAGSAGPSRRLGGTPVALVATPDENEVIAVTLSDGRIIRRVAVQDPTRVVAEANGPAVVLSPHGTVTLLASPSSRVIKTFHGFRSPSAAALTPDGEWAYVADAARGRLSVIELANDRIIHTVRVGVGARSVAVSPDEHLAWVALASGIVILDTTRPEAPRVIRRVRLDEPAGNLAFSPDSRTVWATSPRTSSILVLQARTAQQVARIPLQSTPEDIRLVSFGGSVHTTWAYVLAGSSLVVIDVRSHTIRHRVSAPRGSSSLATSGGLLATASPLTGQIAEYDATTFQRRLTSKPATRATSIAIEVWP